ncbi:bromodomain-containing protein DDB_G0280777 isoform X2 [Calliphora vicina]
MADVNKPKLQLRSGLSINGDKTPSPATKLLINHGKPNFTIQRSPKVQNGHANPLSPTPDAPAVLKANNNNNNNNEFVVKSTTFNGVFKPSNISAATKQTLQENGNSNSNTMNGNDNEAAKVVLRRAKVVQTETREAAEEDGNVPEFILRQRRIQERLANQNILDFENRRSGYFTQVMISPSSPNRQSFAETMASPAVKPGLEIPPPPATTQHEEDIKEETAQEKLEHEQQEHEEQQQADVVKTEETVLHAEPFTLNGQDEEEVAKAIEEVNKAVEGEDDDKTELEEQVENHFEEPVTTLEQVEETKPEEAQEKQQELAPVVAVVTSAAVEEEQQVETPIVAVVVTSALEVAEEQQNGHVEAEVTSTPITEDTAKEPQSNGVAEEPAEPLQNGHTTNGEALDNGITISHTNGLSGPTLPSPDPTGEKGVNFEPKTVVSFSQELGNNVNKYPDTVKVHRDTETPEVDNELKELTKLKFEIKGDDKDIEVKSVLITETA